MPPREGAFAQYVAMPEANLVTVPDAFPLEKAALAEPIAVGWHAARLALEALHPAMTKRALILGGGAIGLATALSLRTMGLEDIEICEPNAGRLQYLTSHCGLHARPSPAQTAPIVIDAVGFASTRASASALAEPGGVIVHVGLGDNEGGLDIRRLTLQEIGFIGTYTYTAQDFRDAAQAMFAGRLGSLDWFETRPLEDGAAAFRDIRAGNVATPKIILTPPEPATPQI